MEGGSSTSSTICLAGFIAVLVGIGGFFLLRSVMLWYWKISHIVELMENQVRLLTDLRAQFEEALKYKWKEHEVRIAQDLPHLTKGRRSNKRG